MAIELRYRTVVEGAEQSANLKKSARELGQAANEADAYFKKLAKTTGATADEINRAGEAAKKAAQAHRQAKEEVLGHAEAQARLAREIKAAAQPLKDGAAGALLFSNASRLLNGNITALGGTLSNLGRLGAGGAGGGGIFAGLTVGAVGAVAAIALVGGALGKLTLDEAALAKEQSNNAIRTGLTLKEYGVWSQVASNAGVNAQALVVSMRTLSKAMDENAEEGKVAKRALDQLFGGAAAASAAASKPTMEFLLSIADAMDKVEIRSRKAELAVQIFGKGGLENLPILNGHLREMVGHVSAVGVGFDDLGAKSLGELNKKINDLDNSWTVFKQNITSTGAGPLTALIGLLNSALSKYQAIEAISKAGFTVLTSSKADLKKNVDEAAARDAKRAEDDAKEQAARAQRRADAASLESLDAKHPIFGNSEQRRVEVLENQLDAAKKKYAEDKKLFDVQAATADKAQIDSLTIQIARVKELASEEKKAREARQSALDARGDTLAGVYGRAGLNGSPTEAEISAYKAFEKRDKSVRDLADKGALTGGDRSRLASSFTETANIEFDAQQKKSLEGLDNLDFERGKKRADEEIKGFLAGLKEQDKQHVNDVNESIRVYDAGFTQRRSALGNEAGKQQRIADLQEGDKTQTSSLAALQRQLSLAQELYALDKKRADFLQTAADNEYVAAEKTRLQNEATTQLAKARADVEEANRKAQEDFLIRTLELEKQRRQEANQLGQELFQAATTRGGLRQFYQGLGQKTATTIAGNVLEGPLRGITGQLGSLGEASGFGQYLKGTLFDPNNKKSPEIQAHEKTQDALLKTRDAVNDLTATLGGTPTDSTGLPGAAAAKAGSGGGALGSLLSRIPGLSRVASDLGGLTGRPLSAIGGDGGYALPFIGNGAPASVSAGTLAAIFGSAGAGIGSDSAGRTTLASVLGLTNYASTPTAASSIESQVAALGGAAGNRLSGLTSNGFAGFRSGAGVIDLRSLIPGEGAANSGKDFSIPLGDGSATTFSSLSGPARFGSAVGTAGVIAGGAFGVYNGIKQGGIRGYSSAIGSGLGTAAALDPEPISKGILAIGALGASLFSALGPDSYKARQDQITRTMRETQYFAPQQMDFTRDLYGNRLGWNYRGGLGQVGQTFAPGIDGWNSSYTQPVYGQNPTTPTAPGAGAAAPPLSITIHAMDAKSIIDRHADIADAVWTATNAGNQRLQNAVERNMGLQ